VQQPLEELSYWFQQPELSTCQSHQLEQENWSTAWGTPDWTTEPPIIQNTGMATPPSSGAAGAPAGRSESSSSDETETISLPSGK
jgi:hypothetical protein